MRSATERIVSVTAVAVGLSLLGTLLPSTAQAAAPPSASVAQRALTVHPMGAAPGDVVTVSGRAALPGKRVVKLQVRRDGRWVTVRTRRTGAKGRFVFDRVVRVKERKRVVAPRVVTKVRSRSGALVTRTVARKWTTAAVVVTPVRLPSAVSLRGPQFVEPGSTDTLLLGVNPAVSGRLLSLQWSVDGEWREFTTVRETGARQYGVDLSALPTGTHRVRVQAPVTARHEGATAERSVTVLDAVVPDPQISGPLPRVEISTPGGADIRSKTDYLRSTMTIDGSAAVAGDGSSYGSSTISARLRVRGNSTARLLEKLPYKVKLDTKTEILGLPASKDWVLLANYYDRSLMRSTAAFHAARRLGVAWAPGLYDVDLYLNGEYRGVYQLGQGIEVEPGRVDLAADKLPADVSNGGWLVEADINEDTDPSFTTGRGIQFFLKESGGEPEENVSEVARQLEELEEVLYGPEFRDPQEGYRALVDVESFVNWYLLQELTKNWDANYNNSVYVQRAVGGRIAMGPPWDFDLSSGIVELYGIDDPEGWFIHDGPLKEGVERGFSQVEEGPHWLQRMLQDPWFRDEVNVRWLQVRERLLELTRTLEAHADRLVPSSTRNFAEKPEGAGHSLSMTHRDSGYFIFGRSSSREHAEALIAWYRTRIEWLDHALPTLGDDASE